MSFQSTWTNKCDLNKDGKIDNSDNVRYSNKCGKFESNSPKACDLNGDWKFDVSDRVRFVNKCYTWELTWNSTESQKVNCDDPVVKLACNPESDECPEVCKSGNNSKKYPDLWALVYIKKQVNLWLTTQYTLWIIKDDENNFYCDLCPNNIFKTYAIDLQSQKRKTFSKMQRLWKY